MTGAAPRRLSKRDVEALLATYDSNPVDALATALRRLLDRPTASFDELVNVLAGQGRVDVRRWGALARHEVHALDALAAELNELRVLPTLRLPS